MRLVPVTPGASAASCGEGRGRQSAGSCTASVVDREGSLAGARLDQRRFRLDLDDFVAPPTSSTSGPAETRSPGLTCTPDRLRVLNDGIVTSTV